MPRHILKALLGVLLLPGLAHAWPGTPSVSTPRLKFITVNQSTSGYPAVLVVSNGSLSCNGSTCTMTSGGGGGGGGSIGVYDGASNVVSATSVTFKAINGLTLLSAAENSMATITISGINFNVSTAILQSQIFNIVSTDVVSILADKISQGDFNLSTGAMWLVRIDSANISQLSSSGTIAGFLLQGSSLSVTGGTMTINGNTYKFPTTKLGANQLWKLDSTDLSQLVVADDNNSGGAGGGDNLGSHIATRPVSMAFNPIDNISSMTVVGAGSGIIGSTHPIIQFHMTDDSDSDFEIGETSSTVPLLFVSSLSITGGTVTINGNTYKFPITKLGSGQLWKLDTSDLSQLVVGNDNNSGSGGGGDNLGTHVATRALAMAGFPLDNVSSVTLNSDRSPIINTTFTILTTVIGGTTYFITSSSWVVAGQTVYITSGNFATILATGPSFAASTFTFSGSTICFGGNCMSFQSTTTVAGDTLRVESVTAGIAKVKFGAGSGGGAAAAETDPIALPQVQAIVSTNSPHFTQIANSTNSLYNAIIALATETAAGGGGGVQTLYISTTLDNSNSSTYALMFTTPSSGPEATRTVSVAAADGLVMLSSHSTTSGGLGRNVTTIPSGFWQFVMFLGIDSIVGQTDVICDVSTMSKTGTNLFKILSTTITNVNSTNPSIYESQSILVSDILISTDDRVLVKIFAKTTSALARTVTIKMEGTSRTSRIGTTIERAPTFISLQDTPASYVGQAGNFPRVNSAATALEFVSVDTNVASTEISGTDLPGGSSSYIQNSSGPVQDAVLNITSGTVGRLTARELVQASSMSVTGGTVTINGNTYKFPTTKLGSGQLWKMDTSDLSQLVVGNDNNSGGAGAGDSLGTHVATRPVSLAGFPLDNVSSITLISDRSPIINTTFTVLSEVVGGTTFYLTSSSADFTNHNSLSVPVIFASSGIAIGTTSTNRASLAISSVNTNFALINVSTGPNNIFDMRKSSVTFVFPGQSAGSGNYNNTELRIATNTVFLSSGVGINNLDPSRAMLVIGTVTNQNPVTNNPSVLISHGGGGAASVPGNPSIVLFHPQAQGEFEFAMGPTFGLLGTVSNNSFFLVTNGTTRFALGTNGKNALSTNGTTSGTSLLDIIGGSVTIRGTGTPGGLMVSSASIYMSTITTTPPAPFMGALMYSSCSAANVGEMFVMDSAGNETKISPHNDQGEWEYFSKNVKTGKLVRVNMEKFIRRMEELTGENFFEDDVPVKSKKWWRFGK